MRNTIDCGYVCECSSFDFHSLPITDKEWGIFGHEFRGMPSNTKKLLRSPTCNTPLGINRKVVFETDNFHVVFLKEFHLLNWDMVDDWLHPARAATGVLRGMVTGTLFWGTLIGIVALAKACTGGG